MSYKEFWEDDPEIFWAYRFYYYKKQKDDIEKINLSAWLNGLYNYNAFYVVLSNAFSSKGKKMEEYLPEPIDLFGANKKTNEEEIKKQRELQEKLIKDRALKIEKILEKNKK